MSGGGKYPDSMVCKVYFWEKWGVMFQGDQTREILVVDACGARQSLQNEQNFFHGLMGI